MVLVKGWSERGFVVFTSYTSRKGDELAANPRAALLFHWYELGRQVRIEGAATRVDDAEADAYFDSRPAGAKLSAAASQQSAVVPSREALERAVERLRERYPDGALPRPERWGGYVVAAESFEFWQHREDRLHDRFRYRREGSVWVVERLAP